MSIVLSLPQIQQMHKRQTQVRLSKVHLYLLSCRELEGEIQVQVLRTVGEGGCEVSFHPAGNWSQGSVVAGG